MQCLKKNSDGRFELPNGDYFTSGERIEIKISEAWWSGRVEHSDHYYVILDQNLIPKTVPLRDGMEARRPK